MTMKPVENMPGLARDKSSNAIVSTDSAAFERYKDAKKKRQSTEKRLSNLESKLESIESLLASIAASLNSREG